jgi:hypothetical protein
MRRFGGGNEFEPDTPELIRKALLTSTPSARLSSGALRARPHRQQRRSDQGEVLATLDEETRQNVYSGLCPRGRIEREMSRYIARAAIRGANLNVTKPTDGAAAIDELGPISRALHEHRLHLP